MDSTRCTNQYTSSVLLGNWFEDVVLQEEKLKDYLERKEKGTLLIQRFGAWKDAISKEVRLSVSTDGYVHVGDTLLIQNVGTTDHVDRRPVSCLAINVSSSMMQGNATFPDDDATTAIAGTLTIASTPRTAFNVVSVDGTKERDVLRYGQPFMLRMSVGGMYLSSDRSTFASSAKKSRHNEVNLVMQPSHLTEWRAVPFDPNMRLEMDFTPVPANTRIVLNHLKTNKNLCLESNFRIKTSFGPEYEVSCNTEVDSHRVEKDTNQWKLMMTVPGDHERPVLADQ